MINAILAHNYYIENILVNLGFEFYSFFKQTINYPTQQGGALGA